MASFKVPCPSCEHQVPIKSEKEIGTKTECPKCKYRFKVEAPAAGVPKDGGKGDKKKPEKAAGDKKKSKKAVAIVVGVLAVAILAAVGFAFMGGDKKPVTKSNPGGGGGGAVNPGGGGDGSDGAGDGKGDGTEGKKGDGEGKAKPKSTIPLSTKDASNLLPGQTVALARLDVQRLRAETPAGVLFDAAMTQMFENSLGVPADQVAAYYHAYVGEARDPFGVIRLNQPVLEKDVVARLQGTEAPKAVNKRALYRFKSNPFVNGVSNALAFASLFGELYEKLPPDPTEKPGQTPRAYGVCVYDQQHILVGDYAQLQRFLTGLSEKGDPKFQSSTTAAAGATLTDTALYLSIEPKLKRAMRELGGESASPPLVVYAEKYRPGSYDPKLLKSEYQPVSVVLDPVLNRTEYLGASLNSFTDRQAVVTVRLVMKSDAAAFEVVKDQLTPSLTTASQLLSLFLHSPVAFNNLTSQGGGTTSPLGPGDPGMNEPGMGGGIGRPPQPGGGIGRPPSPGGGLGPPPQPGSGGQPNYGGGMSPRPGAGQPPGMGPDPGPGTDPGMGGTTTQPEDPNAVLPSRIDLKLSDQNITITVELNWNSELFRDKIEPRILGVANTLKGKVAVFASDTSFHALSEAVRRMTQATKQFPPGTSKRALNDTSRHGLPYEPKTRVSFFAELLPYVSDRGGALSKSLGTDQAWYDDGKNQKPEGMDNLRVGEEWVPELLVPTYPQTAWRATSPLVADGRVLGGTNYVGIAGVGLDAARYDPKTHAKTVGVAGYEWGSTLDEITDGPEYTIYLMQTPPGLQQPWIAGGGATIRGLSETDPMHGFRHTFGTPDGKPGTFALMANGDVRFIPGDIKPDLLLAMATRAGGETFVADRIDKEAPVVLSTKKPEPKPEPKAEVKTEPAPGGPPELAPPPHEKKS